MGTFHLSVKATLFSLVISTHFAAAAVPGRGSIKAPKGETKAEEEVIPELDYLDQVRATLAKEPERPTAEALSEVAALLPDLGHDRFKVRQSASYRLAAMVNENLPLRSHLRELLAEKYPSEVIGRIGQVLAGTGVETSWHEAQIVLVTALRDSAQAELLWRERQEILSAMDEAQLRELFIFHNEMGKPQYVPFDEHLSPVGRNGGGFFAAELAASRGATPWKKWGGLLKDRYMTALQNSGAEGTVSVAAEEGGKIRYSRRGQEFEIRLSSGGNFSLAPWNPEISEIYTLSPEKIFPQDLLLPNRVDAKDLPPIRVLISISSDEAIEKATLRTSWFSTADMSHDSSPVGLVRSYLLSLFPGRAGEIDKQALSRAFIKHSTVFQQVPKPQDK